MNSISTALKRLLIVAIYDKISVLLNNKKHMYEIRYRGLDYIGRVYIKAENMEEALKKFRANYEDETVEYITKDDKVEFIS